MSVVGVDNLGLDAYHDLVGVFVEGYVLAIDFYK